MLDPQHDSILTAVNKVLFSFETVIRIKYSILEIEYSLEIQYSILSQRVLHDFIYYSISRVTKRLWAQRTSDHVNNSITIPALWPTWFSCQKFLSAKDMDTRTHTHTHAHTQRIIHYHHVCVTDNRFV